MDRLENAGATFVRGHGRLVGPRTVEVDGETFEAKRGVVLNPGTAPVAPPIEGLADTPYWTNRDMLRIESVPGLAGRDRRRADRCRAGPGAGAVRRTRHGAGARRPHPRTRGAREQRAGRGRVRPRGHPGAHRRHDQLGVVRRRPVPHRPSTTRRSTPRSCSSPPGADPTSHDLGLETVGLDPSARSLEVDERMRAGEGLWAIGDVVGKGAFTHMSMYQSADLRARHPRPGRPDRRLPGAAARDLHRSRGRVGRDDREAGARRRAQRAGRADRPRLVDARLDRQGPRA